MLLWRHCKVFLIIVLPNCDKCQGEIGWCSLIYGTKWVALLHITATNPEPDCGILETESALIFELYPLHIWGDAIEFLVILHDMMLLWHHCNVFLIIVLPNCDKCQGEIGWCSLIYGTKWMALLHITATNPEPDCGILETESALIFELYPLHIWGDAIEFLVILHDMMLLWHHCNVFLIIVLPNCDKCQGEIGWCSLIYGTKWVALLHIEVTNPKPDSRIILQIESALIFEPNPLHTSQEYSRPVLSLSSPNPLKPSAKSIMKMWLEQRRQVMLQLHLSDQRFYCLLRFDFY